MKAVEEVETERLLLRRWRPEDLEAHVRWNADPVLMRHMGKPSFSREESEASAERFLRHWDEHGFGFMAVTEKASGALIGRTGLAFHRAWPADPEVGWLIDTRWQGRGYATEAGAACMARGFALGFDRVVSICLEENLASRAVMAKLGLEPWRSVVDPALGLTLWVHMRERDE